MSLRVGPYAFGNVVYDSSSDVVYATVAGARTTRREPTPEGHFWLFDERGKLQGLTLMEPRERLERDGAVSVTLPSGERERVTGLESALAADRNR
jgi:hypothetical protein